jgi:hypothetical protein
VTDGEYDNNDNNEEPTGKATEGVSFSLEENCWKQLPHCSQTTLPRELPTEAVSYVLRRQSCSDVQHQVIGGKSVPYVSDLGFMMGPDCTPEIQIKTCTRCGALWENASIEPDGQFVLRTYMGAVLRSKKVYACKCGEKLSWDPSKEFIHTIHHNSEGGESS